MLTITLPDGAQRHFDAPVTVAEIASDIGAGLAKAALAGRIDGQLVDTNTTVANDSEVAILTDRDEEGLEVLRHSTAHLLAHAVKSLFPAAQVTIGPVIDDGFYYDFAFERPFTPEDLEAIEAKMEELTKADFPVRREEMAREEAIEFFNAMGEAYKAEIIAEIPEGQVISLYRQGDFVDLCRGPHIPSTGRLKAFKLTKVAGAYWRGDSRNEMLQRIYGTAWPDKKQLKAYIHRLEEAEKRDHRRLAKQLDLFHFQEEAPGMVFWHEKGWRLYRAVENYMRSHLDRLGYLEINTPAMMDRVLWERSGHWEKFQDDMFTTHVENRDYAVKPMNCPGHILVYNQGLKSYRDLPLRIAEFGTVHRNEPSGTLHGLMRARRFTQDDAHVFCTEDQLQEEIGGLIDLTFQVYRDFGFDDILIALSLRPDKRVGDDELWDKAEHALAHTLETKGLEHKVQPGEGAFYGPKIEFTLRDCIGREWQCGTIQLDFSMPGRLGAHYVDEDGERKTPVMIHRAILGSLERFIGILIEHHAGQLPTWLAPVQAVVLTITDRAIEYAQSVEAYLRERGIVARSDLRNEKIGFKVRQHAMDRIPYLLVVGDQEMSSQSVDVRTRSGDRLGSKALTALAEELNQEIASRGRVILEG